MLKKLHIILIVSILFIGIFSINTYASEEYTPELFKTSGGSIPFNFVVIESSSGVKSAIALYGLETPESYYNIVWKDNNVLTFNFKPHLGQNYFYRVCSFDSTQNNWVLGDSKVVYSGDSGLTQSIDGQIIYSTFDLYKSDGTIFFQPTPVEVPILETIMAMAPTIVEKILETLKILVPFGVGLLALLIGLKILPMVLYKFL